MEEIQVVADIGPIYPPVNPSAVPIEIETLQARPLKGGNVVVDFKVIAGLKAIHPGGHAKKIIASVEAYLREGVLVGGSIPVLV